jgi:hypothetical protein
LTNGVSTAAQQTSLGKIMRSALSLFFGLGACLLTAASAVAQGSAVPDGSYLNSCRNARIEGDYWGGAGTLVANCRNNEGRYVSSLLEYSRCNNDIYNDNGRLRCSRSSGDDYGRRGRDDDYRQGGDWGQAGYGNVPYGSYLNSCRNAYVRGRTLYADCRNRFGFYVQALIAHRFCRGDISNNNGRLNCRTQGEGDWYADRGQITLFSGTDYRGRAVTIDRDMPNLSGYFNDEASSVRVYDGVWLACKDRNYRGGCMQIDRNWRSLPAGGNDNISSIRRIR